jgi:hypothetical protein
MTKVRQIDPADLIKTCKLCGASFMLTNYGGRKRMFCGIKCKNRWYVVNAPRPSRAGIPYDREMYLLTNYGMTEQDYEAILAGQGGVCAICGGAQLERNGSTKFHVDHDHVSGNIRGLLCTICNRQVAWLEKHYDKIMAHLANDHNL